MIRVQQLSKQFNGLTAVDNISFHVQEGENLVLLGTSGCGKTTTLKMINRLITPSSGKVEVNGRDVMQQRPEDLRRGIGYVIQNIGLFPHFTVEENIAVIPRLLGWGKQKIRQRTKELLTKLHLSEDQLAKYPAQLSGGQQQRVGLARALVADPPVILMDEPLGALDPITRESIRHEFKTLEEIRQKTMIMVTHDIHEAFDIGDRVCLMHQGKIQQISSPKDLLFQPATEFVRDFLAPQAFQLQLSVITLEDIMHKTEGLTDHNGAKHFSGKTSVYKALEWFSAQPQKENMIAVNHNGNTAFLSRESLMTAFYDTINQLR